jgi:hypothetical protein
VERAGDSAERMHATALHSLPGHHESTIHYSDEGRAEVWVLSEDRLPRYCVHIEQTDQPMTADEVRATAAALLAFVERIQWSAGQS